MAELRADPGRAGWFILAGDLGFETVPALLDTGRILFEGGSGTIHVDLAGVTRSNSAGLALLIEWLRSARRHGREIAYLNCPARMLATARVSGLDRILPLAAGGADPVPNPNPEPPPSGA